MPSRRANDWDMKTNFNAGGHVRWDSPAPLHMPTRRVKPFRGCEVNRAA